MILGGNIIGIGSLVKNGVLILILNGVNIFSGGLNVNVGSLLLGNSGVFGIGVLGIGGNVMFDGSVLLSLINNVDLGVGVVLLLLGL